MEPIHQVFQVEYRYAVHFTDGLFDPANPLLARVLQDDGPPGPRRVMAVFEAGLVLARPTLVPALMAYAARHQTDLTLTDPVLVLPGGEAAKAGMTHVDAVMGAIHRAGLDRHAYVLAVGGGALLDAVGLAAALAHRGVRLVRVPTTVLAQADGGLGVKTAVNAFGQKNFVGAFQPPWAVLNDVDLLETLSHRDWRAGAAEAVKVALIKDAAFFRWLEAHAQRLAGRDRAAMSRLIRRSAELHLAHIATCGDPFERSSARPLDFGHWAAHKLEAMSAHRLRHGEAVAIGVALDATYAHLAGHLAEGDWRRVLGVLWTLGLDVACPELARPELLDGLEEFRVHLGGRLSVTLIDRLGRGFEAHDMDGPTVSAAATRLAHLQRVREEGRASWAS